MKKKMYTKSAKKLMREMCLSAHPHQSIIYTFFFILIIYTRFILIRIMCVRLLINIFFFI